MSLYLYLGLSVYSGRLPLHIYSTEILASVIHETTLTQAIERVRCNSFQTVLVRVPALWSFPMFLPWGVLMILQGY